MEEEDSFSDGSHTSDSTIRDKNEAADVSEKPKEESDVKTQILGINASGQGIAYDNSTDKKRNAASPPEKVAPGKKQLVRKNSKTHESRK